MALSTATITFDLSDQLGEEIGGKPSTYALVRVYTNIPGETVIDTMGSKIRVGGGSTRPADDGTGSVTVWTPGTGSNPATWQTYIAVDYIDNGNAKNKTRIFGPFTITEDADLADLVTEQEVPPTYLTTVTTLLDGYVDAAAASATASAGSADDAATEADRAEAARDTATEIALGDAEAALDGFLAARDLPADGTDLSASIARQAFFGYMGGGLTLWEDFKRPDITNFAQGQDGYALKSGQGTISDGGIADNSIARIEDNRLRWPGGVGSTPIRILGAFANPEPTRVGMLAVMSAETTEGLGANAVLGTSPVSFGQGSIQLALYKTELKLFCVQNPIVDPYPTLGEWVLANPVRDDDETAYSVFMDFNRAESSVTVHAPGLLAEPQTVTDPLIAEYWGRRVAIQERRQADATDGRWSFLAFAAATATPPTSGVPAMLNLPGNQEVYARTNVPEGYAPTDPQIDAWLTPEGGFAAGVNHAIASIWYSAASEKCLTAFIGTTGRPSMALSEDGVNDTGTITATGASGVLVDGVTKGVRIKYESATDKVRFYSTTDDADTETPTWTEIGTAGGYTAGLTGLFTPPRRARILVGSRDKNSAYAYGGGISRVVWSDVDGTVADFDARHLWLAPRYTDPQGNPWQILGDGWSWTLPSLLSLMDAKGDLIAATGPGAGERVPVGADGTVLMADSSQDTGVVWGVTSTPVASSLASAGDVSNTTAMTTLGTFDNFAAGSLVAGETVLDLDVGGSIDGKATSGGFTGRLEVNGTSVGAWTITAGTTAAHTVMPWRVHGKVYVDTTGAAGAVTVVATASSISSAGSSTNSVMFSTTTTALDLSSGLVLTVRGSMATADVANVMRADHGILRQIA